MQTRVNNSFLHIKYNNSNQYYAEFPESRSAKFHRTETLDIIRPQKWGITVSHFWLYFLQTLSSTILDRFDLISP